MTEVPWDYQETIDKLKAQADYKNFWANIFVISYASGAREGEIYRMKKDDIKIKTSSTGKPFITFFIHTEKHSKQETRPMILNPEKNDNEKWLFEEITKILESFSPTPNNTENLLFFKPYTKPSNKLLGLNWKENYWTRMVRRNAKKALGCNHHWLRHCRAYHMVQIFKQNEHSIKKMFGWIRGETAHQYIALSTKDLEENMGVD